MSALDDLLREYEPEPAPEETPGNFGGASLYAERSFKRELFLRIYPQRLNEAEFCWMMVQRAWATKPEDC